MRELVKKLTKLVNAKSIMTLSMTAVFCVLSVSNVIPSNEFMEIFELVVVFYFGTQNGKHNAEREEN